MKKLILLWITFIGIVCQTNAQNPQWIIYDTSNSELPDNSVYSIVIDDNGTKWVGTQYGGLASFDGNTWTVYNSSNSGLPSSWVQTINIDENGTKWIGTASGGLTSFDGNTWITYNSFNSGLPNNRVNVISIDTNGTKWIGTWGGGLASFNGTYWTTYDTSNSELPFNNVQALAIDKNGTIWIGTFGGGLASFNGTIWTIYNKANSGLPNDKVRAIYIDESGTKWIGTLFGIVSFDDTTWTAYNQYNSGLPSNYVTTITIDKDNTKWIGTAIGLASFDGTSFWITYNTSNSELPSNIVQALAIEENGAVWVGTDAGLGAFYGNVAPASPPSTPDSATTIAGWPVTIDILSNDSLNGFSPEEISLHNYDDYGKTLITEDNKVLFTPYNLTSGIVEIQYTVTGYTPPFITNGNIVIDVVYNDSYDTLDINNIKAGINSDGSLFEKNIHEILGYDVGHNRQLAFEYPKGSEKNTIFCNSLWIGGLDENNSLHIAAQRYKQPGYDFQFGPVSDSYIGIDFFRKWSRVWKVSKQDINYHINNYWKDDYEPVDAIINWPGNGDVANGQVEQMAPYFDKNENGIYEPMQGDYPLIRGDQTVLFIYNDDRYHGETKGTRLKVEIHGMAYAYDKPDDDLLNNTVFVHYDIYNRSESSYYDTYLGTWTDIDLGYKWDDYVGCNVVMGSYYGYNGTPVDGSGEPSSYGENPPAQSVTIVAGPYMDNDQTDNPAGGCDYSVNGLNFGDGIIDNERLGMTGFLYHHNGSNPAQSDPEIAPQYFNYLRGIWKDGTSIMYGGTGYYTGQGTVGPECKFMFPGASDSCNWGTDGILPNGGYNQNGKFWSEETGNNGEPNPPFDRRGLGSTGPFTFKPGDMQELELAFSVGQGEDGPLSSVQQLFNNLTNLFQRVEDGEIIIPSNELSIEEQKGDKVKLAVYPNPVKDYVHIKHLSGSKILLVELINVNGYSVKCLTMPGNTLTVDLHDLPAGIYFIKIYTEKSLVVKKVVVQ